jgi:hypothetical protein
MLCSITPDSDATIVMLYYYISFASCMFLRAERAMFASEGDEGLWRAQPKCDIRKCDIRAR